MEKYSEEYIEFGDNIDESYWNENGYSIEDYSEIISNNDLNLNIKEIKELLKNKTSNILNTEIFYEFDYKTRKEISSMELYINELWVESSLVKVLDIYKRLKYFESEEDKKLFLLEDLIQPINNNSIISNDFWKIEYLYELLDIKKDKITENTLSKKIIISDFLEDNLYIFWSDILNIIEIFLKNKNYKFEKTDKYEYIIKEIIFINDNLILNKKDLIRVNDIITLIVLNYFNILKWIKNNWWNIFFHDWLIDIFILYINRVNTIDQLL